MANIVTSVARERKFGSVNGACLASIESPVVELYSSFLSRLPLSLSLNLTLVHFSLVCRLSVSQGLRSGSTSLPQPPDARAPSVSYRRPLSLSPSVSLLSLVLWGTASRVFSPRLPHSPSLRKPSTSSHTTRLSVLFHHGEPLVVLRATKDVVASVSIFKENCPLNSPPLYSFLLLYPRLICRLRRRRPSSFLFHDLRSQLDLWKQGVLHVSGYTRGNILSI